MPEKLATLPKGTKIPNHIAIIPDGNRRWARARGLDPSDGHKIGAERVHEIVCTARDWGVHTVTFWGLSTENWRERSPKEVKILYQTINKFIDKHLVEAKKDGARIIHLGRKDRLPRWLIKKISKAEKETINNTKYVFNIALDYGGQDEIIRAVQKIVKDKVKPEEITVKLIDSYMDTKDQPYPYPDLLIRTSGEQRTSGLLLWQSDYTEMYWETDHLPAFTPEKLKDAILDYSRRRRRFGGNDSEKHFAFKPAVAAKLELDWWRLANIPEDKSFGEYTKEHLVEQWGLSKSLAGKGAKLMAEALVHGKREKWVKSKKYLKEFYKLIKDEVKLAFEPSLAASFEINILQQINGGSKEIETEKIEYESRRLLSEVYRISDLQARKAAHLRALATLERNRAERGEGDDHWAKAESYLEAYYEALKDRIA